MIGIYTITCKINNKIYIGYSTNIPNRIRGHKHALRNNIHDNSYLQNEFNKYTEVNFLFEILIKCEREFLTSEEHYWCNLLNSHNRVFGYNILPTHPYLISYMHSDETKNKISKKLKGRKVSEKAKIILSKNASKPHTEQRKENRKNYLKVNGHPMKNKNHSAESKLRMSIGHKGKPSPNRKKIISINTETLEECLFNTVTDCALFYKIGLTSISNNLNNRSKTVKFNKIKYKFKYA